MDNLITIIAGFGMVVVSIWMLRYIDRSLKMHTEFDAFVFNIV